jgi:hypothetical protein
VVELLSGVGPGTCCAEGPALIAAAEDAGPSAVAGGVLLEVPPVTGPELVAAAEDVVLAGVLPEASGSPAVGHWSCLLPPALVGSAANPPPAAGAVQLSGRVGLPLPVWCLMPTCAGLPGS